MKKALGAALACMALCAALTGRAWAAENNCHDMAAAWFGGASLLDAEEGSLSAYFAAREGDFRASLLDAAPLDVSEQVQTQAADRTRAVGEMQARLDIAITDAAVNTRTAGEPTDNGDGTYSLYVYEWTFFDYDDLYDGPGGNDVSGFGTWHKLTLDGNGAVLSDEYDETDLLGVSTVTEETRREMIALGYLPTEEFEEEEPPEEEPDGGAVLLDSVFYTNYDVQAAIDYSETYWEHYNPAYANFNSVGGDCANFTSQCIRAGGMPMVYTTSGWYYRTASDRGTAWASSTNMRRWMSNNRGILVQNLNKTILGMIFPGSPVYYSTKGNGTFQHTVICVGKNSAGVPIINSHNRDRYHVVWSYYSGSVQIDTVQLTANNLFYVGFAEYADLGAEFDAQIYNAALDRYVTNEGEGTVSSKAAASGDGQFWHFTKLSDNSYRIASLLDQTLLTAEGESSRSAVSAKAEGFSQSWHLFPDGNGGYWLRPIYTERVLDIVESSADDGAPLWIFGRNGTPAQIFEIRKVDLVTDRPDLAINAATGEKLNVSFAWAPVQGAVSYHLYIFRFGYAFRDFPNLRETAYAVQLDPGDYAVRLDAVDEADRTVEGELFDFTVEEPSYAVVYDANGGEGAPAEEVKVYEMSLAVSTQIPVRKGYVFLYWNTAQDGSGETYRARKNTYYRDNAEVTFYAQWEPIVYMVFFEVEDGVTAPDSVTVTVGGVYGELPEPPERERYTFLGW